MTVHASDEAFMRGALERALQGWGRTHPNPMVGAVIVEEDRIAAGGFHAGDGGPHAERVALEALGRAPRRGASLYATLEPCSTAGRTGACTGAILLKCERRWRLPASSSTAKVADSAILPTTIQNTSSTRPSGAIPIR